MPVSLDLRAVIKEKVTTSGLADPRKIADSLIDDHEIPRSLKSYEEALRLCLPHEVREQIRLVRNEFLNGKNSGSNNSSGSNSSNGSRSGHDNQSSRWKQAGVYGLRFYTGQVWKTLGECTWQDIEAIRDEYARRERESSNMRRRFDVVLKLRTTYGSVSVMREIPAEILESAISA